LKANIETDVDSVTIVVATTLSMTVDSLIPTGSEKRTDEKTARPMLRIARNIRSRRREGTAILAEIVYVLLHPNLTPCTLGYHGPYETPN